MRNLALELHQIFNKQKRYCFPFDNFINEIPKNGIYIIFEKGERYKNLDRIVRVGTHTGNNQLRSRLKQHFIKENKNRSIFRKNIGRCFLNIENDPYLNLWELDITSKADKEKNLKLLNLDFEKRLEEKISDYIQNNLSFSVFQIDAKENRFFWERKIASTLAKATDIKPSKNWLGNYSTKNKIKTSGLWQVNELNKESLTELELEKLKNTIACLSNNFTLGTERLSINSNNPYLDVKNTSLKELIKKSQSTYWDLGNETLYKLCRENFDHKSKKKIIAKVWLIGRSYAAAIERRRNAKKSNNDFYIERVIPKFQESELDSKLNELAGLDINNLNNDSINRLLTAHKYLTDLTYKLTEQNKRSFSSKYLHFHIPNLFFIYDSRAVNALAKLRSQLPKTPVSLCYTINPSEVDKEYATFICNSITAWKQIKEEYNIELTPRQFDNLLMSIDNLLFKI